MREHHLSYSETARKYLCEKGQENNFKNSLKLWENFVKTLDKLMGVGGKITISTKRCRFGFVYFVFMRLVARRYGDWPFILLLPNKP